MSRSTWAVSRFNPPFNLQQTRSASFYCPPDSPLCTLEPWNTHVADHIAGPLLVTRTHLPRWANDQTRYPTLGPSLPYMGNMRGMMTPVNQRMERRKGGLRRELAKVAPAASSSFDRKKSGDLQSCVQRAGALSNAGRTCVIQDLHPLPRPLRRTWRHRPG